MKFEKALQELRNGNKVARKAWDQQTRLQLFLSVDGSASMIQRIRRRGEFSPWLPQQEDILADDYELFDSGENTKEEV